MPQIELVLAIGRYAQLWHLGEDTPASLNQSGPYRFVRHPFYTSYSLTWLAAAVATASAASPRVPRATASSCACVQ